MSKTIAKGTHARDGAGKRAREPRSAGFTLIESLLAIGILGTVAVQILGVMSGSIAVTQTSRDNMRATWALRSTMAQLEYVLDTVGVKALPKEASFEWSADPAYKLAIVVKDTPIEASRLLSTAMRLGNAAKPEDEEGAEAEDGADPAAGLKDISAMLDSQLPKDMYRSLGVTVSWIEGETPKTLEGGALVIDTSALNFSGALAGLAGGIPGMSGLGGEESGGGNNTGGNSSGGNSSGGNNNAGGNAPGNNANPNSGGNPGGGGAP